MGDRVVEVGRWRPSDAQQGPRVIRKQRRLALREDVFKRDDGSFGFEEFRGESDGAARWQSLSKYGTLMFPSGEAALASAKAHVPWLRQSEIWRYD